MKRLKEPSSWAGLAALLQVAKVFIPAPYHVFVDVATAAAGSLAVKLPEVAK